MLLQLKTSELGGGGGEIRSPQVERVFKSPGKVGLRWVFTLENLNSKFQQRTFK